MKDHHDDMFYVRNVLAGNTAAFAVLVEQHSDMAFTIAHKIVRNREDAEEIAQDAFVKAFQSLHKFKGDSKFSTWLYRIVYNAAISHTRRHRQDFVEIDERIMTDTTDDEVIENLALVEPELQQQMVMRAVEKLPADDSAIVTLFYLKENTIEDISLITGLSISNVKVKLFRIRKRLYNDLQMMMQQEVMA